MRSKLKTEIIIAQSTRGAANTITLELKQKLRYKGHNEL